MSGSRFVRRASAVITGVIFVFAQSLLLADEEAEAAVESNDEVTEEIIVYGPRLGDRIDVDARYEEFLRSNLMKKVNRDRELEEGSKWRLSLIPEKSSSRIRWGYDLDAELRIRRNTELLDLPIDDTKPATIFRFEFD